MRVLHATRSTCSQALTGRNLIGMAWRVLHHQVKLTAVRQLLGRELLAELGRIMPELADVGACARGERGPCACACQLHSPIALITPLKPHTAHATHACMDEEGAAIGARSTSRLHA